MRKSAVIVQRTLRYLQVRWALGGPQVNTEILERGFTTPGVPEDATYSIRQVFAWHPCCQRSLTKSISASILIESLFRDLGWH